MIIDYRDSWTANNDHITEAFAGSRVCDDWDEERRAMNEYEEEQSDRRTYNAISGTIGYDGTETVWSAWMSALGNATDTCRDLGIPACDRFGVASDEYIDHVIGTLESLAADNEEVAEYFAAFGIQG